ncbi:MAG TPA: TIGR04222 domain-containing membrane protein [Allosphingosinicella sp.]|nr:TIGR04222 domain-containing membrane protein [Allosphingosinicella sp.]
MSLGPFDLTGGPFLILYGCLFILAVAASLIIPRRLRPEGRWREVTDLDQLAWLAGGRARFADALVARMLAGRALKLTGRNLFSMDRREAAATPAERSLLALEPPVRWSAISRTLRDYAEPLERKLEQQGLVMTRGQQRDIAFWATLPLLMLLAFGATKWVVGDLRERPIGFLTAALIVTALLAIARYFTVDRRTKAGLAALDAARTGKSRLRRAPTTPEIGLAVALFGTAALAGSPFEPFHKERTGGGDGGGGGGGDGGGSGCGGGGGCGGCGGG